MDIATVISWIFTNTAVWLFLVAVIVTIVKVRRARFARRVVTPSYILWGETLFYTLGVGFVYVGVMHAYFGHFVAPTIGWAPSPFEYELGWAEIGLGIVALLSLWRGYEMRLAATLIFATFSFAAAAQHVSQMLGAHNYAPGNAGLILWWGDIALPVVVLILAYLSREAHERHERIN
jgi:hypothetical protein